ncbi:MAG: class I SAM-dependent rRNA methyltransferase [Actinomycetia bacterium]|nr:class I SAM-dependent rRNA methyltransferase [Actinomycetes bacterium]
MPPGLQALPRPAPKRLAVRVSKPVRRHIRKGHPWVYDEAITSVKGADGAAPGDLAVVFDDDRSFLAIGLWDPNSPIRIRILHTGKPLTISRAFWQTRIEEALDRRDPLAEDPATTGWRVIHGEDDRLPGLVVDRYDTTLVVKLYTAAWIPHLADVVPELQAALSPERIVVRLARTVQRGETHGLADGDTIVGHAAGGPVEFLENGLRFEADVVQGQKTGHFLDQRDNRARVADLAQSTDVLDVFSCTGGFSVHAAAGGARSVHSIDMAPAAIDTALRNMARNGDNESVAACGHRTTVGDAFEVMADLAAAGEQYDIVVVDPPSFASKQADIGRAVRAYGHLTRLAVALIRPGGVLVQASCSNRIGADEFFTIIHDAARLTSRRLEEIERTGHAIDHPIGFEQGSYLKALFTQVN